MSVGDYVVVVLMLVTFGVLIAGIALMAAGGAANQKYGNRLMFSRVSMQGLALLMLAFMFMLGNG
jgi:hypothetical protein